MRKDSKRSKKKTVSKSKTGSDENCSMKQQEPTTDMNSVSSGSSTTTYTPLQLEQANLAKELDTYITEFQQKVLRLNFTPSDRELVILFIMNLHPRFRRFVEPAELSCSTWIEAAAFARLHCTRISVMLGCERHDTDPMFRSPESKALIDSGYFISSFSPSASLYPREQTIQHLLLPTTTSDSPAKASPTSEKSSKKATPPVPVSQSDSRQQLSDVSGSSTGSEPGINKSSTEIKSVVNGDIPLTALSIMENNAEELMEMLHNPEELEKGKEVEKLTPAKNSKKDKAKDGDKQYLLPRVTAVKSNGSLSSSQSICYRVPAEHSGVNLTFLELEINNIKVKGLLAKVRWGSSAIALDCVKRLGLAMKETNNFCIYTDFGYEDSIGIMKLPIVHPADPSIKSEMEIQVLPQIYGGHVDLVLGADFFYYFNPMLNIRTRAIHFLGKEAPYIVGSI